MEYDVSKDDALQKVAGLATVELHGTVFGPRCHLAEEASRLETLNWSSFEARRLAPTIGAEISDIDLTDISDDEFAELRQALLEYKVLVIRNCGLDQDGQIALSKRFGELEIHPFLTGDGDRPEIVRLTKDAETGGYENNWHSDVTWKERPAKVALLRSVSTPEVGGDTLFADMHAAWGGLSDEVKSQAADAVAVHDFALSFGQALSKADRAESAKKYPPVEHPVVRTHDETGQEILYVNAIFTSHVVGMSEEESESFIRNLCKESAVPEYSCRVQWSDDTLVIWDNRSTQHYANSDYWPNGRVMERTTVQGDRPI